MSDQVMKVLKGFLNSSEVEQRRLEKDPEFNENLHCMCMTAANFSCPRDRQLIMKVFAQLSSERKELYAGILVWTFCQVDYPVPELSSIIDQYGPAEPLILGDLFAFSFYASAERLIKQANFRHDELKTAMARTARNIARLDLSFSRIDYLLRLSLPSDEDLSSIWLHYLEACEQDAKRWPPKHVYDSVRKAYPQLRLEPHCRHGIRARLKRAKVD